MSEEIKMVPPGDLANADAATPKSAALLPCPFCGFYPHEIRANGGTWNGGMRPPQPPVSYDVIHFCPRTEGQPSPRVIQRCGKTEADAIAAWNARAPSSAEQTSASGPGMNPDQFKATHP